MAKIKAKLRNLSLRGETTSSKWGPVTFDRQGLAELDVDEADLPLLRGLKWLVEPAAGSPKAPAARPAGPPPRTLPASTLASPPAAPPPVKTPEPELAAPPVPTPVEPEPTKPFDTSDSDSPGGKKRSSRR
jgi:hypothetical protein